MIINESEDARVNPEAVSNERQTTVVPSDVETIELKDRKLCIRLFAEEQKKIKKHYYEEDSRTGYHSVVVGGGEGQRGREQRAAWMATCQHCE